MSRQTVAVGIVLVIPYFDGHVVGAGCQQLSGGVPLDGIDLVGMSRERLHRGVAAQFAHMDVHVGGARSEGLVRLPINVQGWCTVERENLFALTRVGVPNYSSLIHSSRQHIVALFVPF